MKMIAGGASNNNVLHYTVIVDDKKFRNRDGVITDSFAELYGNDGIFTEIASESSRTGFPVLIDFAFVKDVNRAPITKNSIIINDENVVRRLTLPIVPPSCELERTLDVAYHNFFEIYKKIDSLVQEFTNPKSRLKEVQNDIEFFKDSLLNYIFYNSKENQDNITKGYYEFKNGIKYCNSHGDEILSLIEQSTNICTQIVNIIYEFKDRGATPEYYRRAKALNGEFGQYPAKSIAVYQSEILTKYIKLELSHSYHMANEFISEYEEIIKNLSIFNKTKPFDVLFKEQSSQDKYIKDVIDLALIAVTDFGGFDRKKTIVSNKPQSEGRCIYETSPRLKAELDAKAKQTLRELFGDKYKEHPMDDRNGKNGRRNGPNDGGPNGPLF